MRKGVKRDTQKKKGKNTKHDEPITNALTYSLIIFIYVNIYINI